MPEKRYPLPFYEDRQMFPDDPDMWSGWTAQDYTLAYALDVGSNVDAEALVEAALTARHPDVADRVRFDSESGCFFAYAGTEDDMSVLASVVADLVGAVNPSAVPGTIADSPMLLRRWDVGELGS